MCSTWDPFQLTCLSGEQEHDSASAPAELEYADSGTVREVRFAPRPRPAPPAPAPATPLADAFTEFFAGGPGETYDRRAELEEIDPVWADSCGVGLRASSSCRGHGTGRVISAGTSST